VASFTITPVGSPRVADVDQLTSDLYGLDLAFRDDLLIGPGGDYLLTDGRETIRQAVMRRLATAPGEYAVRPQYGVGVGQYVKRRLTRATLDELRQRIVDQLAQEDRIEGADVTVESWARNNQPGVRITVKCTIVGQPANLQFDVQAV
jgi:phage baseplate assembly protein W